MFKILSIKININFLAGVSTWENAKIIVRQRVGILTNSFQQVGSSLQETAATTTDIAIDKITNTLEQAKSSIDQTWQTAEQIHNTTSLAIKTGMTSYVNDFLAQHPAILRLLQILSSAINHPILSLVVLLFSIAFIWSIIKAIIRLIETASWSIIQFPLKLIQSVIQNSFVYLKKIMYSSTIQQATYQKVNNKLQSLPTTSQIIYQDKQQRLVEIIDRLEVIQEEQKELLQEVANLMNKDNNDFKSQEMKKEK
ncbi:MULTISPECIES: hypothetical protein [unclassified Anabaena]|uniref:hypothetical protein n=1 Tax=unclassified Anabaena TaxID=2619674 RepID=UPI0039C6D0E5